MTNGTLEEAPPTKAPRHLWDYWRIIWEGRRILLTVLGVTLAVAIVGTLLMPKRYRAQVMVEIELSQQVVLGIVTERAASRSFFEGDREFKTEFIRIKTSDNLRKAIEDHDLLAQVPALGRMKDPVQLLKRCIEIDRIGQSNAAFIAVGWGDPAEAALLANAIAGTYVTKDVEDRVAAFDARIERLRGSLEEKKGARREALERELAIIRSGRDLDELLDLPTLKNSSTLETLWQSLNEARQEAARALVSTGFGHPSYLGAQARVRTVESQVKDAVDAAVKGLEAELASLGGDASAVVASNAPITSLQRESDVKLEKDLSDRVAQEEILKRSVQSKARIMDPALPPLRPSSPKWSLNIMLALIVGLGFGGGIVFFRDYLDQSVKTIDDVERDLELPLLSVIPQVPAVAGGSGKAQGTGTPDRIARESYQTLRTGLLFASGGRKDKILLVTSSAPQEGKTSVVVSLARALAAAGESVVVVDGDLRRAQLTRVLGASRTKGLSTYLADESLRSWRDVATQVEPNLTLLATGPLPPNPVDLLGMPRFRELLQELRGAHAWVIIDSPPVSSVADPVLLASMSEMVLVVLRHDKTDKEVLRRALHRLSAVGARIIGAVLNGVDMEKSYNREYYYGRFFYGTSYGEDVAATGTEGGGGPVARARKLLK